MTINIKLSAAVADALRRNWIVMNPDAAITAALEAMVKEGTARYAYCEVDLDEDGDVWWAGDGLTTGDFPALIIRLDGGKN